MPRKDTFHDVVKKALIADGWRITHDPLHIPLDIYATFFEAPFGRLAMEGHRLNIIVFDDVQEAIVQWIESTNIDKS